MGMIGTTFGVKTMKTRWWPFFGVIAFLLLVFGLDMAQARSNRGDTVVIYEYELSPGARRHLKALRHRWKGDNKWRYSPPRIRIKRQRAVPDHVGRIIVNHEAPPSPAKKRIPDRVRAGRIHRLAVKSFSMIGTLSKLYAAPAQPDAPESWAPFSRGDLASLKDDKLKLAQTVPETSSIKFEADRPKPRKKPPTRVTKKTRAHKAVDRRHAISRRKLARFLTARRIRRIKGNVVRVRTRRKRLAIHTTLSPGLHRYLVERLKRSRVVRAAAVLLDPVTGRVLALADYDAFRSRRHRCLDATLAASVFKIVTATAAIEDRAMGPGTKVVFRGDRYTLYASQISPRLTGYLRKTTLSRSFAQSINPVFGRIGLYWLGRTSLYYHSRLLGFNKAIPFEMFLRRSRMIIPFNRRGIAGVASGLNKTTTITPLHAALIAATFVNNGVMVVPRIVDRVIDHRGRLVYSSQKKVIGWPVAQRTARQMRRLMIATVKRGTGARAFMAASLDPVLSRLYIGGKSGTLNSKDQTMKYDWFVGFAKEKRVIGPKKSVAFAVLMVHSRRFGRGVSSKVIAREAIKRHFTRVFRMRRQRPAVVRRTTSSPGR